MPDGTNIVPFRSGYSTWPPAATVLLRRLWNAGMSARAIAEQIQRETGYACTKNSVIGRANRMRLGEHPSSSGRTLPPMSRPEFLQYERARKLLKSRSAALAAIGIVEHTETSPALPDDIFDGCRYIAGEPTPIRPGMYCGAPTPLGSAWCEHHRSIVYHWVETRSWPR